MWFGCFMPRTKLPLHPSIQNLDTREVALERRGGGSILPDGYITRPILWDINVGIYFPRNQ